MFVFAEGLGELMCGREWERGEGEGWGFCGVCRVCGVWGMGCGMWDVGMWDIGCGMWDVGMWDVGWVESD